MPWNCLRRSHGNLTEVKPPNEAAMASQKAKGFWSLPAHTTESKTVSEHDKGTFDGGGKVVKTWLSDLSQRSNFMRNPSPFVALPSTSAMR